MFVIMRPTAWRLDSRALAGGGRSASWSAEAVYDSPTYSMAAGRPSSSTRTRCAVANWNALAARLSEAEYRSEGTAGVLFWRTVDSTTDAAQRIITRPSRTARDCWRLLDLFNGFLRLRTHLAYDAQQRSGALKSCIAAKAGTTSGDARARRVVIHPTAVANGRDRTARRTRVGTSPNPKNYQGFSNQEHEN